MNEKVNIQFSVLIFSSDKKLKNHLKSICSQWDLGFVAAAKATDVLAYDYRIGFIDKELFNDELMSSLNELAEWETLGKWKAIILGGSPDSIPVPLNMYCRGLKNYTNAIITELVEEYVIKKPTIKQEVFKKRIHRIVFLMDQIKKGETLYAQHLCKGFGISERTLFRDLKIIKEVFPDLYFEYDRSS
jgi:hypothetical protein